MATNKVAANSATQAKRTLAMVSTGITALEAIARVGRGAFAGGRTAQDVLDIVGGIVAAAETVLEGLSGAVTQQVVEQALTELGQTIAANDAAADTELDRKFPTG